MFTVTSPPRFAVALAASSIGLLGANHDGVFCVVRVPLRAMCFGGISCLKSVAPQKVFTSRNGFQVFRIAAVPNAAKVVKLQALRNGTHQSLVDHDMSHAEWTSGRSRLRVPLATKHVRAQPTARDRADVDLRPNAIGKSRIAPCTIEHIDSSQSVTPRGVRAPAGPLSVIISGGGDRP